MKKNMGSADRFVRFILAILFAALYYTGVVTGIWAYVLLGLGVIFVLTSMVGTCPLYSLLGINTGRVKKSS